MDKKNKEARLAGLAYLLLILFGIISLIIIPSKIIVWEDSERTLQNLRSFEQLFRVGIATDVITFLIYIILPLLLYKLLNVVHKSNAIFMVTFALLSVPLSFSNLFNKLSILDILEKTKSAGEGITLELANNVMLYFESYYNGIQLSQVFWGLWLLPFGYLVFKSEFLPKILGIILMLGCFGYLTVFFGKILIVEINNYPIFKYLKLPASIGEIGICLWLLVFGARNKIASKKRSLTE